MQITDVKIKMVDSGTLKAFVSVTFDNEFVVTGLKVVEGSKGLFVSMPSAKNSSGEYKDTAFPLTKDFREALSTRIIAEYEDLLPIPTTSIKDETICKDCGLDELNCKCLPF